MNKLFAILLLLFCGALTLPGDAVVVIRGKERRTYLRVQEREGLTCRIKRFSGTTEINFRPRRDYKMVKLTFEARKDDEVKLTLGGGFIRSSGNLKDDFEWIDCNLFRINGKELIGPNAGKGGKKTERFLRPKALPGSVKLRKGDKLVLELSVRRASKDEIKKQEESSTRDERQKKKIEQRKARDAERAQKERQRREIEESNLRIVQQRYGLKSSGSKSNTSSRGKRGKSDTDHSED